MLNKNYIFKKIFFMRFKSKILILFLSFIASSLALFVPFCQKELLDYLTNSEYFLIDFKYFSYLVLILIFAAFSQLFLFFAKYLSQTEGGYLQEWLSNLTYAKALRVRKDSENKMSVGDSLSIYATDIQTSVSFVDDIFPNFLSHLLPILLSPFAIYFITGMNPLPIFILVIFILFINIIFAIKQGKLFFQGKYLAAERIGIVSEWLQNIRVIRMLGCIEGVEQKIIKSRELETENRIKMVSNASIINSIGYTSAFFINIFSIFMLFYIMKYDLSAGKIFSLFWLFGVLLTRPMRMIPIMFVSIFDSLTSMKRIQKYWEQELEEQEIDSKLPYNEGYSLKINNLSYFYSSKLLLDNISLDIKSNEFIGIIGEYGSGKSLIIQAILNLISIKFGEFKINDKSIQHMSLSELRSYFSYVPQDFFVINSNLRDNVAFEYNYSTADDEKISDCLEMSQFNCESERFIKGLESNIGEKGVNLSGGQKQRISLARACFSDRPIILLDDCLSALDIKTQEKLIEDLIKGHWRNKIRILVTHKLAVLQNCDRVLFVKDGKIIENGRFNEILDKSEVVRNFAANLVLQE